MGGKRKKEMCCSKLLATTYFKWCTEFGVYREDVHASRCEQRTSTVMLVCCNLLPLMLQYCLRGTFRPAYPTTFAVYWVRIIEIYDFKNTHRIQVSP
jgi:hypothetical protein